MKSEKMSKKEKLEAIDKVIDYFQNKLETSDDTARINAKIVKWTMIREKIKNNRFQM